MHVYIFMHVSAYACIRMHGMHIPLAGAAHQGGYVGGVPRTLDPGTYIGIPYWLYPVGFCMARTESRCLG